MLTYGGGPADRVNDEYGKQEAGIRLRVFSDITGREWGEPVITGPHGRVPVFELPREWEWTQVSLITDAGERWPMPTPRELQGTAAVYRLREKVEALEEELEAMRGGGDGIREDHLDGTGVDG